MEAGLCNFHLGDVVRFGNGKSIRPGGAGLYPVFGSNGIIGGSNEYLYENGIIIGRVGAYCGSVAYCPDRFWASDNTLVAFPASETIDTKFLHYLLVNAKLGRYAGGAAQPLVTQTVLKQVPVFVPPLAVQRRVAHSLSAYDSLIENNRRRIQILEEMVRTIYREWFVEFRFPGHEKVPRVPSSRGDIPKGWVVKRLDELVEIKGGKQLEKEEIREAGRFPVFGGNGVQGFSERATHEGFVIAFGRVGAYCGSIHWSYGGAWLNNNSSSIVPLQHSELVLNHLLDFNFTNLRGGAAQPFISNTALAGIELLFPGDSLAEKFC